MKEYLHFTKEELASEESFVCWVKKSDKKDVDFWETWLEEHPEKRTLAEQAKALVLAFQFEELPRPKNSKDQVWKRIADQTQEQPVGAKRRVSRVVWLGLAASFLALVYFVLPQNSLETINTSYAQIEQITLPDGSLVYLNASSKVEFDRSNFLNDRKITLEGEAFFEVEKGSSFEVNTSKGTIEVLGTSFNVLSRQSIFMVECETGRVRVTSGGFTETLNPKEKVIQENNHNIQKTVSLGERRSNWKEGVYHYNGQSLSFALEDLKTQFKVHISIDDQLAKERFTGSFKSNDLEKALSEICWPFGLNFKIDGDTITIFKE